MTSQAPSSAGPNEVSAAEKRPWFRRTWVLVTTAAVVFFAIGAATGGGGDPTTSSQYKTLAGKLTQTKADLETSRRDANETRAKLQDAEGDLPQREADLSTRLADVTAREGAVTDAEAAMKVKDAKLKKREKAVGIIEDEIAANTIGDGLYEVGADIKAGTYKTKGSTGCYYAVLNSSDTFDIANNNNVDGPAVVQVRNGQYLEITGCADWVLQR